jgi:hypothetical protein
VDRISSFVACKIWAKCFKKKVLRLEVRRLIGAGIPIKTYIRNQVYPRQQIPAGFRY